ncbi:MAG: hypothetical protein OXU69_07975 [Gemmatimonadota bacterium]|nr:hypothetical protein [Gemmatimonadota bacterium]MDE2984629.1 hypothetical protein [Gemmatimonadota bacterium]
MTTSATAKATYRIIDSYDHPHGGRILRLRLSRGEALTVKELKGGAMVATAPDGSETPIRVDGFALFGGKPGNARLARTGRVDVHVRDAAARDMGPGWELAGPG